jgi:hypothetical protein
MWDKKFKKVLRPEKVGRFNATHTIQKKILSRGDAEIKKMDFPWLKGLFSLNPNLDIHKSTKINLVCASYEFVFHRWFLYTLRCQRNKCQSFTMGI